MVPNRLGVKEELSHSIRLKISTNQHTLKEKNGGKKESDQALHREIQVLFNTKQIGINIEEF